MSVYLARVEFTNGYKNIRPVMEILNDGLVEVDESKFGDYGTIQIGALQYAPDSPFLQEQKYCIFSLDDAEFYALESAVGRKKIRAQDFIRKCKSVDSSALREVINLPEALKAEDFRIWGKEVVPFPAVPFTKSVYLADATQIFGPFLWEQTAVNQYKLSPNANKDDPNDIGCYRREDFVNEPIYTFDAAKEPHDILLGLNRYVVKIDTMPPEYKTVDCIDDEKLKDFVSRLLGQPLETKREKKELREKISALPTISISDDRRQRILGLVKNGEDFDQAITSIISDIFRNNDAELINSIVDKVLSNSNYRDRLLEIARQDKETQKIFSIIESEKETKEAELTARKAELKEIERKIELAKTQSEPENTKSSDEVAQLLEKVETLTQQLSAYEEFDIAESKYQKLLKDKDTVQKQYDGLRSLSEALKLEAKDRVESAYATFAKEKFDGALSNMILQEATRFDRENNLKKITANLVTKASVNNLSGIETPSELVDFLYQELTQRANRTLSKNDIYNLLICLSQGFLTILAGDPGTGKTSLVTLLSKMLGLTNVQNPRYTEIAVEKGWTSRRDLIGYYNPLTKTFDASNKGLFSALQILHAEQEANIADFPYLVLLDEANLSQMEYYWADFMSLCDFDKGLRKVSVGEDYEFLIPDTLRFIATINLDHTTEILSPRLIDRAWIIKLHAADLDIDDFVESEIPDEYPLVGYSVFHQLNNLVELKSKNLDAAILEKFNRIRNLLQNVGLNFSPRILGMIKRYCLVGKEFMDDSDNNYVALDYAVAQKVLPAINGYGTDYQKLLTDLTKECDQTTMPLCYELLMGIQKRGNSNMQYYQFFAR